MGAILTVIFSAILGSQCAMCRAVLETGADAETAKSLNDGIVYLMVIPYILVGVVGYAVYRQFYKK
ncbi:MAG: hypothetical protein DBW73_01280 [Flavobacteriales bacterium]|jgi:hypothetical protein|nr:MAG: hypothetical protein DBW73_01280 [Flavobacteriales bacterium]|tara:strand:+ start:3193 stop:3390 length:198 start_codon:yes stop_codon:yes gene_type:complete